ncbi:MAG: HEAT repeat domain-containing protein [Candidatus Saganbacteria bacterium]|nr:HEAT repeat domain-containing protein [Candidatus Saganbacteria bacterium]
MGLWCNGVEDSTKKLQLDYFGSRQRLFKRLGYKDRNNNGVIDFVKKSSLNKLIKADEGYHSTSCAYPVDDNCDQKIDENEAWRHYARISLNSTSLDPFFLNELKGKDFNEQKKFLDKVAGHLKGKFGSMIRLLSTTLQIGINNKSTELIRYVIHYLQGNSKNKNGIDRMASVIGQKVKGFQDKDVREIIKKIIKEEPKEGFVPFIKTLGGILGKNHAKTFLDEKWQSTSPSDFQSFAKAITLLAVGAADSQTRTYIKKAMLSDVNFDYRQKILREIEAKKPVATILKESLNSKFNFPLLSERRKIAQVLLKMGASASEFEKKSWHGYVIFNPPANFHQTQKMKALGDAALPSLKAGLRDNQSKVRAHAVLMLRNIKRGLSLIVKSLRDRDLTVREMAITCLKELKEKLKYPYEFEAIRAILQCAASFVEKMTAIEILGDLKYKPAIPELTNLLLTDKSDRIRRAAAEALVKMDSIKSILALKRVLKKGPSLDVRKVATAAIKAFALKKGHPIKIKIKLIEILVEIGQVSIIARFAEYDKNNSIRIKAIQGLSKIKHPAVIPVLLRIIEKDKSPLAQKEAMNTLTQTDNHTIPGAMRKIAINHRSGAIRLLALKYTIKKGGYDIAPTLSTILKKDSHPKLRKIAAKALSKFSGREIIGALSQSATYDKAGEVRSAANYSLGKIATNASFPDKIQIMAFQGLIKMKNPVNIPVLSKFLFGPHLIAIRRDAAWGLGLLKSPKAIPALIKAVQTDKSYVVQITSIRALAKIGGGQTSQILLGFLAKAQDNNLKIMIVNTLGKSREKSAVPAIKKILNQTVPITLKISCIKALGKINTIEANALLRYIASKTNDPYLGGEARIALEESGHPDNISFFSTIIKTHDSLAVRCSAARALGRTKSAKAYPILFWISKNAGATQLKEAAERAINKIQSARNIPQNK